MPGFNIPQLIDSECRDEDMPGRFKGQEAFPGPSYTEETARNHRYLFETIGGRPWLDPIVLWAFKATRPTPEIDEITIHSGQDEIYRPGKNRWKPIEISFYERLRGGNPETGESTGERPLTNQVAELIYGWWSGFTGRDGSRGRNGVIDIRRSAIGGAPQSYYRPVQLQLLDGVGNPVWTYHLADCWPVRVTPSDLSYADTEIATITFTLRYNKAIESREF